MLPVVMRSIRTKLAIQYAATLAGALAVLAFALFAVQGSAAVREATERAALRGDLALRVLRSITSEREPVVVPVPDRRRGAGAGTGEESRSSEPPRPTDPSEADLRVRFQLDALPGILLAFNQKGEDFYRSADVHRLSTGDSVQLWRVLRRFGTASSARAVLNGESVVLVRRVEENPNLHRYQVVTGVSVGSGALGLLGSALVIIPVLLLGAVAVVYTITSRALEPLDRITSEVAAISDGKSLHRRLHTEGDKGDNDEWGRLIAQLNAMIGRLETSFGALRRFTADASHELKTPLAVLRADVERAMHVPQGSSEQLVALEEALQETTRMASLVESLLTLARADEGRFDLHRERVELLPLVRDVYETALILGEEAGLTVTMPVAQDAIVDGDPTRLRQLLLNLITNAIKYTPQRGEVELSLVRSDDEATFSVRDTGIGIAAADLPHIFERFYRADRVRSRTDERGGFGLGLSISQWIAQAHGGSLVVQSRLHRGSTFTVTLPLATDEAEDEPEGSEPAAARAAH